MIVERDHETEERFVVGDLAHGHITNEGRCPADEVLEDMHSLNFPCADATTVGRILERSRAPQTSLHIH